MEREEKRAAWNYAFGMIKVDGLEPSGQLTRLAELEIKGQISEAEIYRELRKLYGGKANA